MRELSMKQKAENCDKLANILEAVPPRQFDMGDWVEPKANGCGTRACALGWAALSGQFEGLAWGFRKDTPEGPEWATDWKQVAQFRKDVNRDYHCYASEVAILNGKETYWDTVGEKLFGGGALTIFTLDTSARSQKQVVKALREEAVRLDPTRRTTAL